MPFKPRRCCTTLVSWPSQSNILNKPARLTTDEFDQIKRHVEVGADILSLVPFPYPVVPIVRCHHENWDGSGYPGGVTGTDIPIGARILSVVDCYDALTSDRPYRRRLTEADALAILVERRGTMYDPEVVDRFMSLDSSARLMERPEGEVHASARAASSVIPAPCPDCRRGNPSPRRTFSHRNRSAGRRGLCSPKRAWHRVPHECSGLCSASRRVW